MSVSTTNAAAIGAAVGCAAGVGLAFLLIGRKGSAAKPVADPTSTVVAASPANPPAKSNVASDYNLSEDEKSLVYDLVEKYVENWHAVNNDAVDIGQFKLPLGLGTIDLFPDAIEKNLFKKIWSCVVFNMLEMQMTVGGVKMRMYPLAAIEEAMRKQSRPPPQPAAVPEEVAAYSERLAKNENLIAQLSKRIETISGDLTRERQAREKANALEQEATRAAQEMAHELATLRATAADPEDGLATAIKASPNGKAPQALASNPSTPPRPSKTPTPSRTSPLPAASSGPSAAPAVVGIDPIARSREPALPRSSLQGSLEQKLDAAGAEQTTSARESGPPTST